MNVQFHRMKSEHHQKHMEQVAGKFSNLHANLAEVLKKLMKNLIQKTQRLLAQCKIRNRSR